MASNKSRQKRSRRNGGGGGGGGSSSSSSNNGTNSRNKKRDNETNGDGVSGVTNTAGGNKNSNRKTMNGTSTVTTANGNGTKKWRWIRTVFWGLVIVLLFGISFIAERMLFDIEDDKNDDGTIGEENNTTVRSSTSRSSEASTSTKATKLLSELSWSDLVQDTRDKMKEASTFRKSWRPSLSSIGTVYDYIELFLLEEPNREDDGNHEQYPFDDFLRSIGEKDVNMTSWDPPLPSKINKIDGDSFASKRTVSYMHPVTNPLAPPWARSVKDQHLLIFDQYRMAVITTTTVHDVPKADCFVVEDRLLIELKERQSSSSSSSSSPSQDFVSFDWEWSSYFTSVFHKSTMFKGIITRSTTQEYLDHWMSYRDFVLKNGPFAGTVSRVNDEDDDDDDDDDSSNKVTGGRMNTDSSKRSDHRKGRGRRQNSANHRAGGRRRERPHADTPLPWLSFMVGTGRPLLSFTLQNEEEGEDR